MPTISSRTPEGVPNRCPICDATVCIEPSQAPGDGPCPSCGHLLWFSPTSSGVTCYDFQLVAPFRDRVYEYISARLGINHYALRDSSSFTDDIGADSLDVVELIMEIEEEFGLTIPDKEAEQLHTIADLIDYLFRHSNQ
jgi:acyl carrier protein